jgi:hypothetical protein
LKQADGDDTEMINKSGEVIGVPEMEITMQDRNHISIRNIGEVIQG